MNVFSLTGAVTYDAAGNLLAAETQACRRHFHLDHLETPRLITRATGDRAAYHVYYPSEKRQRRSTRIQSG